MYLNRPIILLPVTFLSYVCYAHQHSVVIIGAGSAGLAAATRLLAHNVTDIVVLEAENRIGGRVNTVHFGDDIVDLGAEWVDGTTGNIVYELVKDLDLLGEPEPGWDIILFSDGTPLGRNRSEEINALFGKVSQSLVKIEDRNKTTGDAFAPAYKAAVEKKYKNDPESLDLALKCLSLIEKILLARDSAFSWHDSVAARTYREIPGTQGLTWRGKGFKQLFNTMAKKIPNTNGIDDLVGNVIHLNKVLRKIHYYDDKPVTVTCRDGSEYQADYVIFTPSLGVLKLDHKDLFAPTLPQNKIHAIEQLGFGAIMKIVLHYDNILWPSELNGAGGYNLVFTEDDEKEIATTFPNDPIMDGKSWISSILGLYPLKHNPNVLVFWVVGHLVPEVEQLSDDRIKIGIDYLLTKFFGHQPHIKFPKPDKIIKTNWYSNPHFRGTYSFETVQAEDGVHGVLAEPLKNEVGKDVVFFAGEATLMKHYATVHGAVESGHREAYMILKKMGIEWIKL